MHDPPFYALFRHQGRASIGGCEGSLTQLHTGSICRHSEQVNKHEPLYSELGGLFFWASEATALVEVASPLQGQSSNGALLS